MAGGLFYATQVLLPLIGSKTSANTRTGIALTSAYQAENAGVTTPTKTFDVGGFSRAEFVISYTEGAAETANSIQMKVEFSPDGTNFYQLANDTTSGATSTMTAREFTYTGADAATANITWGIDIAYKEFLRVSFKETGVASNAGNVFAEVLLSGR